jgi:hypothetical protein
MIVPLCVFQYYYPPSSRCQSSEKVLPPSVRGVKSLSFRALIDVADARMMDVMIEDGVKTTVCGVGETDSIRSDVV